jgi:hypothetical protein
MCADFYGWRAKVRLTSTSNMQTMRPFLAGLLLLHFPVANKCFRNDWGLTTEEAVCRDEHLCSPLQLRQCDCSQYAGFMRHVVTSIRQLFHRFRRRHPAQSAFLFRQPQAGNSTAQSATRWSTPADCGCDPISLVHGRVDFVIGQAAVPVLRSSS